MREREKQKKEGKKKGKRDRLRQMDESPYEPGFSQPGDGEAFAFYRAHNLPVSFSFSFFGWNIIDTLQFFLQQQQGRGKLYEPEEEEEELDAASLVVSTTL